MASCPVSMQHIQVTAGMAIAMYCGWGFGDGMNWLLASGIRAYEGEAVCQYDQLSQRGLKERVIHC